MKRLLRMCLLLVVALFLSASIALAQPLGRATADFTNTKPNRQETPWGRLVADAIQSVGKADVAVVNAGALQPGTLEAGSVEMSDVTSLLSFGEDDIVTLSLSGAQIRAALERAASAFPTGSPAFLHCSGVVASFDPSAPSGKRVTSIRIKGRNLDDQTNYATAMPISLAEGAAGYFNIWNGVQAKPAGANLQDAIASYIHAQGEVTPDETARFGPK